MLWFSNPHSGSCGCQCGSLKNTLTVTLQGIPGAPNNCVAQLLNGTSLVLAATNPINLVRVCPRVQFGSPPIVSFDASDFVGDPAPLVLGDTTPGSGLAKLGRKVPELQFSPSSGSGGTFTVALKETTDVENVIAWTIERIDFVGEHEGVTNGFSSLTSATPNTVGLGTQQLLLVEKDGVLREIVVIKGGTFYAEDESLPAIVADIDAPILQLSPSNGSGAEVSITVDDDVNSPTFGQASVELTNAGENYMVLGGDCRYSVPCSAGFAALQFLAADDACSYPGFAFSRIGLFRPPGRNGKLRLTVSANESSIFGDQYPTGGAILEFEGATDDCNNLPELEGVGDAAGGTATLEWGGTYLGSRGPCCDGCPANAEDVASIVSVAVTLNYNSGGACPDGNVTLTLTADNNWQANHLFGSSGVSAFFSFNDGHYYIGATAGLNLGQANPCYPCPNNAASLFGTFIMERQQIDGQCFPVGFAGSVIERDDCPATLTVSATVALA